MHRTNLTKITQVSAKRKSGAIAALNVYFTFVMYFTRGLVLYR